MAVTILGGQVLCLLLTLLITPVVYSYFDDLRQIEWLALLRRGARRKGVPSPAAAEGH
jgi:HAE1 family hydrophobic/amphiphilic exporter-1